MLRHWNTTMILRQSGCEEGKGTDIDTMDDAEKEDGDGGVDMGDFIDDPQWRHRVE